MRRSMMAVVVGLFLATLVLAADTPGETAVKEAIKTLKQKRTIVKDKGDQALLDAAIKDLEERLAQVGKGEPEPEAKKDEPFVMPKNWELKFNTGKNRPTFDPKTGELKLAYDFTDAKQLKDFEYDAEVKPQVQKGALTIKGGDEIKHVVKFSTVKVSFTVLPGHDCDPVATTGGVRLQFVVPNGPSGFQLHHGNKLLIFDGVKTGELRKRLVVVKDFFITNKRCGVTLDGASWTSAVENPVVGQLVFKARQAPNVYAKLTISGTLDPEWAKEFFADGK